MTETSPIIFSGIRKGDTISHTWVLDGLKHSTEGVADHKVGDTWYNAVGAYIASQWGSGELMLVARSKKKLPTEEGSVIIATELHEGADTSGQVALFLDEDGDWMSIPEYLFIPTEYILEWVEAQIMPLETIVKES